MIYRCRLHLFHPIKLAFKHRGPTRICSLRAIRYISRPLSTSVQPAPKLLGNDVLVEEENVRGYKAEDYYPVRIGKIFLDQYKTTGKLGFGSASTVWLCRNLRLKHGFVALKVCINRSKVHRELSICQHIQSIASEEPGRHYVRQLLDSFEIEGPHGKHICLVYEVLGNSLAELNTLADGELEAHLIRQAMRPVLSALQFLHTEAHVIHTDLQPSNILLGIHDDSILTDFEKEELEEPSPRKELDGRTIYLSRPMRLAHGLPSVSDFSEARFGETEHTDLVMPDVYRAPEVILGMPWSYPIDVWAFAMVIWDLFEPNRLFTPRDEDGRYSEAHHLAQMISVMGPPPVDFLRRSSRSGKYWDQDGNWTSQVAIPDYSLEAAEKRLESQEKADFLSFMRKMLQWKPEDRSDWDDVFMSEWLVADLIESGHIVRSANN